MRSMCLFVFALCLLSACATGGYRSPGDYHGGRLLGAGTYFQEVTVEPKGGESFRFQAMFQRRITGVMVTGLALGGPARFRVKDNLKPGGAPRLELFAAEQESQRARLLTIYQSLRPLLMLEDKPALAQELVKERYPDRRPKRLASPGAPDLLIEEYGWDGLAARMSLEGADFRARITLREFTPEQ